MKKKENIRTLLFDVTEFLSGIVLWFTQGILFLRFFFRMFNANPDQSLVEWVYSTSESIMTPFTNIFPNVELAEGFIFETNVLFAMISYSLIFMLIFALIDFLQRLAKKTK